MRFVGMFGADGSVPMNDTFILFLSFWTSFFSPFQKGFGTDC